MNTTNSIMKTIYEGLAKGFVGLSGAGLTIILQNVSLIVSIIVGIISLGYMSYQLLKARREYHSMKDDESRKN